MFERFSDRARHALRLAWEEARGLGHQEVSTGHLLLGLVLESGGMASVALRSSTVSADALRRYLHEFGPNRSSGVSSQSVQYGNRAKKAFELGVRDADAQGHHEIGTGHLLVGLLSHDEQDETEAPHDAKIMLRWMGVDSDDVIDRVTRTVGGHEEMSPAELVARPALAPGRQVVQGPHEFDEYEVASADDLRVAFGEPVYVPTIWPAAASPPTYFVARSDHLGKLVYRVRSHHRRGAPILVGGGGSVRQRIEGESGWRPLPELSEVNGHVNDAKRHALVVVECGALVLDLIRFSSLDEAVEVALGLECVGPDDPT